MKNSSQWSSRQLAAEVLRTAAQGPYGAAGVYGRSVAGRGAALVFAGPGQAPSAPDGRVARKRVDHRAASHEIRARAGFQSLAGRAGRGKGLVRTPRKPGRDESW